MKTVYTTALTGPQPHSATIRGSWRQQMING